MKAAKKVVQEVKGFIKPELKVIVNKGVIVDNSKLPLGCHYCELKWGQFI